MNTWLKRIGGSVLVIAGVLLFVRHLLRLLDRPHLYPDMGRLSIGNILLLCLTLLFVALAWIAAAYLLLNTEKTIVLQLLPAAAFVLLLFLGGLCLTGAVGEIPCTYTDSLTAFREDFDAQNFRVRGKSLYPGYALGELTEYACYEKDEVLAETVTRSYDQDGFSAESVRLSNLAVPATEFYMDPRERPSTLYELRVGDTLWQVLLVPKTKTVTYSRFNCPEQLPGFAPQPTRTTELPTS